MPPPGQGRPPAWDRIRMAVSSELRAQPWGSGQNRAGARSWGHLGGPGSRHTALSHPSPYGSPTPRSFPSLEHPGGKGQSASITAGHRADTRAVLPLPWARGFVTYNSAGAAMTGGQGWLRGLVLEVHSLGGPAPPSSGQGGMAVPRGRGRS